MDALQAVFETSQEAMLLTDELGVVTDANAHAAEVLGYSRGELVGLETKALIEGGLELGRAGTFFGEVKLVRKGGARFPAEISTVLFTNASGQRRRLTTIRDLSALDALRESQEKFRALVEATTEGITIHKDGVIILTNLANDVLFGGVPRSGMGRNILDFVAPEWRPMVLARSAAGATEPYEIECLRDDGTSFPAEVRAKQLTYRGETVRMVAIRDLTERKRLEAKLALADRLASIGALAAGVAHEINNPLAYVVLNLELIRRELKALTESAPGARTERARGALESSFQGIERVKRIVKDLGGFARAASDDVGAVDLERSIRFAASMAQSQIERRGSIVLSIDAPPVRGNETRVGQVFLNLLINAAQALPEGDPAHQVIEVIAKRGDPGWVEVLVSDTGDGIPPELLSRIFEPFVTTKPVGQGTGLGLSIVHGIVASLGGSIDVESVPGKGTTFRLKLREADAPRESRLPEETHAAPRASRLLFVDDEHGVRDTLAKLLEGVHDVVAVGSAREAVALLERGERFDALLCDLMMPEMTGMALCRVVAERWPDLAAHTGVLTGGAVSAEARQFLETTHLPRLDKPFDLAALEAFIGKLVGP